MADRFAVITGPALASDAHRRGADERWLVGRAVWPPQGDAGGNRRHEESRPRPGDPDRVTDPEQVEKLFAQ